MHNDSSYQYNYKLASATELLNAFIKDYGFKSTLNRVLKEEFSKDDKVFPDIHFHDFLTHFRWKKKFDSDTADSMRYMDYAYLREAIRKSDEFIFASPLKYPSLSSAKHKDIIFTDDFLKHALPANTFSPRILAALEKIYEENNLPVWFSAPVLQKPTEKDFRNALKKTFADMAEEKPLVFTRKLKKILDENHLDTSSLTKNQIEDMRLAFLTPED